MLPALAAASPTQHASPALSSLGRYRRNNHHHGVHLHLRRLLSLAAAGRARGRLLASAFASADGGAGQVKLSSSSQYPLGFYPCAVHRVPHFAFAKLVSSSLA